MNKQQQHQHHNLTNQIINREREKKKKSGKTYLTEAHVSYTCFIPPTIYKKTTRQNFFTNIVCYKCRIIETSPIRCLK